MDIYKKVNGDLPRTQFGAEVASPASRPRKRVITTRVEQGHGIAVSMAATTTAFTRTPISTPSRTRPQSDRPAKRVKEAPRADIWTSLLRQTREAQARSRTSTLQHRSLILCGGSPSDQQAFARQSLTRPPPPEPPSRNNNSSSDSRRRDAARRGEVRLSNRWAYGYGHVTLYSAPASSQGFGAEAEEVGRVEVHTLPEEAEVVYEGTLRRLLQRKRQDEDKSNEHDDPDDFSAGDVKSSAASPPVICLLLSWKEPWRFLASLRRWLQLFAQALLPPESAAVDDPLDVLKEHSVALNVIVQHVEAQEDLEREGYKEEAFDYISQCLRTCLLPLSASLLYTPSNPPPQPPGSPLSEVQKVIFTSLGLDLGALTPAPGKSAAGTPTKREDLGPRHNVVDRMAIVVPRGWDSVGKIRLLSETFSPEALLEAWIKDLAQPFQPFHSNLRHEEVAEDQWLAGSNDDASQQANGGAENQPEQQQTAEQSVYATSDAGSDDLPDPLMQAPNSASTSTDPNHPQQSALAAYANQVFNPKAHKAASAPTIETTTQPDQEFLASMRAHLAELEVQEAKASKSNTDRPVSTTLGASGRVIGLPAGEQTGALHGLGDVSFNVGGVNFNADKAEAAIERLKQRGQQQQQQSQSQSEAGAGIESPSQHHHRDRVVTPRQPRREEQQRGEREVSAGTPTSSAKADLPVEKLEEYFRSLMKKGGGGGASGSSTPSKSAS